MTSTQMREKDFSVRDVDMVPAVRQALEALPSRTAGGLVFPRAGGAMFARSTMGWTWEETVAAAGVPKIRPTVGSRSGAVAVGPVSTPRHLEPDGGAANRTQELSEIARGIKSLAKEIDIPIVAMPQMSRAAGVR